jgi:hypothetical protein
MGLDQWGFNFSIREYMDPIARTTRSESGERGRSEMVQTICGHSRCGAGARANRHPAEVMICTRAATVGKAVAM